VFILGAKIVLTGIRSSLLRKTDKYYAFEMILGGSPTAPKGLPLASASVQYTVFVSLKAAKRANLELASDEQKWIVQGEIVLDVPVDECPGEIGVVAYQISVLPAFEEPVAIGEAQAEVAATVESPVVEDVVAFQMVLIESIHLPEKFQGAWLNPEKTESLREWIIQNGKLDKPLDVCVGGGKYWLSDGYRRYVIAGEVGLTEVPIRIV